MSRSKRHRCRHRAGPALSSATVHQRLLAAGDQARRLRRASGREDLDTTDLAAIHRAGLRLGVSTHDDAELARALAVKPSYIALGHIFPTQTKDMPSAPQG